MPASTGRRGFLLLLLSGSYILCRIIAHTSPAGTVFTNVRVVVPSVLKIASLKTLAGPAGSAAALGGVSDGQDPITTTWDRSEENCSTDGCKSGFSRCRRLAGSGFHLAIVSNDSNCAASCEPSTASSENWIVTDFGAACPLSASKNTCGVIMRGPTNFFSLSTSNVASAARALASAILTSDIACNSSASPSARLPKWISPPTPAAIIKFDRIRSAVSQIDFAGENARITTTSKKGRPQ
jgi:hypothetical protein